MAEIARVWYKIQGAARYQYEYNNVTDGDHCTGVDFESSRTEHCLW